MTPDKRVEEIIHNLELCECEHISGVLQSERIRLALTQYHQDLMSEVVEKIEGMRKGLVTLNCYGNCNPRCHDSGKDIALSEALTIIKSK